MSRYSVIPQNPKLSRRTEMRFSKTVFFLTIVLAAAFLGAVSCSEDRTILYNDLAMGDIVNGKFISDAGFTYIPVEQKCDGQLESMDRAIILCDILKKVSPTEYEVRINQMSKVLKKDCLKSDEVEDLSELGDDPVLIKNAWISAGYLNMETRITFLEGSTKSHLLNLLYDKEENNTDTLHFKLLHNGYGECYPTKKMIDEGNVTEGANYAIGTAYASFPITGFLPEGKDVIPMKVKYTWYVSTSEGVITSDTYTRSVTGYLTK